MAVTYGYILLLEIPQNSLLSTYPPPSCIYQAMAGVSNKYQPIRMSRYSEDEPILENTVTYKSFNRLLFNIFTICFGSFYFGYGIAYFSIFPIQQIITEFKIDMEASAVQGLLNGITPGGAFMGAILSSLVLKYFSRKNSLLVVCAIGAIGGGITLISQFYTLIAGRFIVGLALGLYSSICPLIINELSPPELSGVFGTMNQLFIVSGVVISNLLTLVVSNNQQVGAPITEGWRFIFSGVIVIVIVQAALLLTLYPNQTPKYLLINNKDAEAKKLIEELYLPQYSDIVYDRVLREARPDFGKSVMSSVETEPTEREQGNSKIAILMGFHCAILQQMCGINVIVLYCGDILDAVVEGEMRKILRILVQAISLVGCFGATYFIKKLGRKTLLQVGAIGIGLSLVVLGICFSVQVQATNYIIIAFLYIYMLLFGFTLGPIVWLYIPEIVAAKWVPFTTMSNWGGCVVTVLLFPIIRSALGSPAGIFFFLGAYCFAGAAINHFFLVESKNKSQREISDEYYRKCQ